MKPFSPGSTAWFQLRIACAVLLLLPAVVQAQFSYTTNNGTITITKYTGTNGVVAIPDTINGLPVTSIGSYAFANTALTSVAIPNSVTSIRDYTFWFLTSLTNVTISSGVTSIGFGAFMLCSGLANITIPESVKNIGDYAFSHTGLTNISIPNSVTSVGKGAFYSCSGFTNVTIPNTVTNLGDAAFASCNSLVDITVEEQNPNYSSMNGVLFDKNHTTIVQFPAGKMASYAIPIGVTNIGNDAFYNCTRLTNVTIPNSVTSIGVSGFYGCIGLVVVTIPYSVISIEVGGFYGCSNLTSVYFKGNAPNDGGDVFNNDDNATVYYLPGTTGWSLTFAGRPTVLWNPQPQTGDASFGVRTNQFGFNLTGSSNLVVVVEAATNLTNPVWSPLQTNTLNGGAAYFSDPQWTNQPARFYRLRSP